MRLAMQRLARTRCADQAMEHIANSAILLVRVIYAPLRKKVGCAAASVSTRRATLPGTQRGLQLSSRSVIEAWAISKS